MFPGDYNQELANPRFYLEPWMPITICLDNPWFHSSLPSQSAHHAYHEGPLPYGTTSNRASARTT
jgi:hypothetical protein